jgi:hypothetical protein
MLTYQTGRPGQGREGESEEERKRMEKKREKERKRKKQRKRDLSRRVELLILKINRTNVRRRPLFLSNWIMERQTCLLFA